MPQLVPVNQNGFPLRLSQAVPMPQPQQKDPAQPEFMQRFLQLLMQLRAMPPQQQAGIPGVNGGPVQAPGVAIPPPMIGGRG